jgi:enterobacterial common antigen flippase
VSSYKDIAKSSGLIAFVQVAQMIFTFLRNKVISVLLGSSAFGLYSLYNTLIEMCTSIGVFGIDNSAVREISRCKDNKVQLGNVYFVCNRLIAIFSVIVCVIILIFASEIGQYMFNEVGHEKGIRCVAFIVLFMVAAKEGYAVLNGIRSMKCLAISQIISSAIGSIGTIIAIILWREDAIPAALGIIAITMAIITFLYVKKEGVREIRVDWIEFKSISRTLLYIGAGVTIAGVISTVMTFLSKSYLTEHYTLSAVGLYQSSWTVSNLYTGIILSAMGVDFMPRLSKIIDDKKRAVELINQQIIFGVVVASIAITSILLFSKEILYILYAREFEAASNIIRWHILGVFLRVIAFPFSYTILAKGKALIYAIVQVIFWTGDYLLLIVCSHFWGFDGLGINYPVAYFFFLLMTFFATKSICGFTFSKELLKVLSVAILFIVSAWIVSSLNIVNYWLKYLVAGLLLILHLVFIDWYMKNKMDINFLQLLKRKFSQR